MNRQPDKKELRTFAFIFGAAIGVIGGAFFPWRFEYPVPLWPWVVFMILSILGLAVPSSLKLPYKIWMRFGIIMNAVMSRLILGVSYYLTVLPIGLLLKLTGKDTMGKHFDKAARTYRVISAKPDINQMKKPF